MAGHHPVHLDPPRRSTPGYVNSHRPAVTARQSIRRSLQNEQRGNNRCVMEGRDLPNNRPTDLARQSQPVQSNPPEGLTKHG
jgi:hypothetical protein